MPKSRGRPRRKKKHNRAGRGASRPDPATLRRYWTLLQRADAAEARGDARAAMEIISQPVDYPGVFWRPWRIRRLEQLVALQPILPGWATSRWLLSQALAWVDLTDRRNREALEIAVDARGGGRTLVGHDATDAWSRVMDHDWIYRQVRLYDHGVLDRFLRRVAAPDLVAGADRVRDWVGVPMDGFELVGETCRTSTWRRLSTGEEVEALNLGASTLLHPGWAAIGRMVPLAEGWMFETAPLPVPFSVAREVAAEPGNWVDPVRRACHDPSMAVRTTGLHDYEMLTDVPRSFRSAFVLELVENARDEVSAAELPPVGSSAEAAFLLLGVLRSEGFLTEIPESSLAAGAPMLAGCLVEPMVSDLLAFNVTPDDLPNLERLAGVLTSPAAELAALVGEVARSVQRSA